jgi:hypothetical protein
MIDPACVQQIAERFVHYLETGHAEARLFSDDVFCDFTPPRWRIQASGLEAVLALRRCGHPGPGSVPRWRCDATPGGFVIEVEERWRQTGKDWYCRELMRATLRGESICELAVYCTGDWDADREAEHRANVTLLRA